MEKVMFIIGNDIKVEEVDGNLTHNDILKLAQEKGANGCYIIRSTVIDLNDSIR